MSPPETGPIQPLPEPDATAHRFPILRPEEGETLEQFLRRAAVVHQWPAATLDHDLALIAESLRDLAGNGETAVLGAYILRALSFAAHSSMALRNLDRYLRTATQRGYERIENLRDNAEHLHFLCSFFSFSTYLSEIVIKHPDFFRWVFRHGRLHHEKSLERYRTEAAEWMRTTTGIDSRRTRLTAYKKREQLRIGVREILEHGGTLELCRELSNLAQAIIEIAYQDCLHDLVARHGRPISEAEQRETGYCIYAMGKFGAGELNFSSDVDLVFLYDEEGQTEGVDDSFQSRTRRISNHEFFSKLSREIAQYLSNPNEEGFLLRVDARLRPEGESGPLARSRSAYAAYLSTQAAMWEKIAYIKARFVAGSTQLARVFDPIVEQFVYANNEPAELLPEVARLKRRIDTERLDPEGLELDIKRGRGGIREIEFVVAALQLTHGQETRELRVRPTLQALDLLVTHGRFDRETARRLARAYHLFRRIEHTLQMMHESQTHRMPVEPLERERLSIRCGYARVKEFETELASMRNHVRSVFEEVFHGDIGNGETTLLDALVAGESPSPEVLDTLSAAGLGDTEGFHALQKLAVGTREFAPSARGQLGFQKLLPLLLEELPWVALPRQAVHHFDLMLRAAKGFTWVYELCLSHPPILKLLLRVLGFGSFLARQLIAHPEWLDEILHGTALHESRTDEAIAALPQLLHAKDIDDAFRALRAWKQMEAFHIAVQEVLAVTPSDEGARRTTLLAQAVLENAARLTERQITGHNGAEPWPVRWAVIGLGGLGDRHVHANGDVDVAFVCEDNAQWQDRPGVEWVDRIAQSMIRQLGAVTPEGQLWKIDARLRPEGEGGPLAATRTRYLQYYESDAGVWEWQALTKARPVAGDAEFGRQVLADLYDVYTRVGPPENLAREIHTMRRRMEANIRLPKSALFDFKTGRGGVVDCEFLTQFLQLSHHQDAATLFPLTTQEAIAQLTLRGELHQDTGRFIGDHLALLRILQRHHRLLWETNRDHYPADQEKQAALHRGMADQLMLTQIGFPVNLQSRLAEMHQLFEDFFQRHMT